MKYIEKIENYRGVERSLIRAPFGGTSGMGAFSTPPNTFPKALSSIRLLVGAMVTGRRYNTRLLLARNIEIPGKCFYPL